MAKVRFQRPQLPVRRRNDLQIRVDAAGVPVGHAVRTVTATEGEGLPRRPQAAVARSASDPVHSSHLIAVSMARYLA